jgi:hypothetical protein
MPGLPRGSYQNSYPSAFYDIQQVTVFLSPVPWEFCRIFRKFTLVWFGNVRCYQPYSVKGLSMRALSICSAIPMPPAPAP